MHVLWGIGGMVVLLGIAFALSTDRRAINPRTVLGALAIQIGFAVVVLYWDAGQVALSAVSRGVQAVIDSSNDGINFLFGPVLPSQELVFAFQVLPVIIFFASLTSVLYHWRILQRVVQTVGGGLQKALGTSRAESVSVTADIFLGQTEAPLVVRPYIARMTRSEFFTVMVGGLSSVAGSVLVGYALLGARLEYLIAASFMAAPGALLMAKIIMPETDRPQTMAADRTLVGARARSASAGEQGGSYEQERPGAGTAGAGEGTAEHTGPPDAGATHDADDPGDGEVRHRNVIDAAANGASDGLRLALNIGAMLIAFISLIALLNLLVGAVGGWFGLPGLTFEQILGYLFSPLMFATGVPWNEAVEAGSFLGQKVVLNEFVAFSDFGPQADTFTPKTSAIITFALAGFANFGSLGILLGGLGGIVPKRRPEIAQLGIRAVAAGTLANLMSATIAGVLIG